MCFGMPKSEFLPCGQVRQASKAAVRDIETPDMKQHTVAIEHSKDHS